MPKKGKRHCPDDPKVKEQWKIANESHRKVQKAWRGALVYARKSGEALNDVRWLLQAWKRSTGQRTGWKEWVKRNFEGSYETATVYIRIAKKWDDPRVQEARNNGILKTSIKGFLDFLNCCGKTNPNQLQMGESAKLQDMLRDGLRKGFAEALRELEKEELELLERSFWDKWGKWRQEVYDATCCYLQYDLDEDIVQSGRSDGPRKPEKDIVRINCEDKRRIRRQRRKCLV